MHYPMCQMIYKGHNFAMRLCLSCRAVPDIDELDDE